MKFVPVPTELIISSSQRFWNKVEVGDGCWQWMAGKKNGYGRIRIGGRKGHVMAAHRMSWILHFGDIEEGMIVCHKCDNPSCVKPDHLFTGTHQDNTDDCINKGRAKKATGDRNKKTKINSFTVRVARRLRKYHGLQFRQIAKLFGLTLRPTWLMITGKTWKHIPMP